jgi:hypothetical protein
MGEGFRWVTDKHPREPELLITLVTRGGRWTVTVGASW